LDSLPPATNRRTNRAFLQTLSTAPVRHEEIRAPVNSREMTPEIPISQSARIRRPLDARRRGAGPSRFISATVGTSLLGNCKEEVVLRPVLLWFLGISIVVIILPYLFYVVYQWR
jgi:hypothetical protein